MSKYGKIDWDRLQSYSTTSWMELETELEGAIRHEVEDRQRRKQDNIARGQKKAKRKRRRQERANQ